MPGPARPVSARHMSAHPDRGRARPVTGPGHRRWRPGGSGRSALRLHARVQDAVRSTHGQLPDARHARRPSAHLTGGPAPACRQAVGERRGGRVQGAQGPDPGHRVLLVGRLQRHHRHHVVVVQLQAHPRGAPVEADRPHHLPRQVVPADDVADPHAAARRRSTRGRVKSRMPSAPSRPRPIMATWSPRWNTPEPLADVAGTQQRRAEHHEEGHHEPGPAPSRPAGRARRTDLAHRAGATTSRGAARRALRTPSSPWCRAGDLRPCHARAPGRHDARRGPATVANRSTPYGPTSRSPGAHSSAVHWRARWNRRQAVNSGSRARTYAPTFV